MVLEIAGLLGMLTIYLSGVKIEGMPSKLWSVSSWALDNASA
jgi:hypothetical protein